MIIKCLQSIFSWKNKVKVAAADRVGTFKFNGVDESSEKTARFEGSAFYEEEASPLTVNLEMRTHENMTGPPCQPLISVPSMAEWGKVDGGTTACVWSDNDDQDLEAAEAKKRNTSVIPVEFDDFNFPNSLIVEEDHGLPFPPFAIHVDGGTEVAYEGGDEDEELAGASDIKECESDPSSSEGVLEVVAEETAEGHILVNESTRYYETRSNAAKEFGGSDDRHFSDGEICQVEIGNDYVSDPGVYNCKDMEMAASSLYNCDAGSRSGHQSEDLPAVEMRSKCLLSDFECGSQHVTSTMTGHQVMRVSGGSGSSVAEVIAMNVSGVQATVKAIHVSTSHSEKALRVAKDMVLNMNFSEQAERQQQRPWWKVFLFTHRNVHRRDISGVLSNGCMGYSSEVDCCNSGSYPMLLQDHQPFQHKTIVGDNKVVETNMELEHCVVDKSTSNFDVTASLPIATSSSLTAIEPRDIARDQKVYNTQKAEVLSRVEEWVSSINLANAAVDEDIENDGHAFREPGSPTAPASTFFSSSRAHSSVTHQLNHTDGDGSITHYSSDAEMAVLIARSVNPLSTVAYFSGVGLRIIPPLALYNGLKTLNLSANHIVRVMPGLLPRSLHSLDLSRNKIVVIEGLRELTRLRVLNLSHNRISRIGHGLAGCSSLRELHLAGNKISEIEGLHRLLKLSLLDLSFNKLTTTKAISQLAANYNSLQALNLLGNPLHNNLGDEPLRKLVTGLAPQILYFNKRAMKTVSARDAAVDSVARAALGTPSHHHHTPRGSKGSRGGLSAQLPAASASQGKYRNGEILGLGHSSMNMVMGGYLRTGMTKETTHKQQYHHHHHHHHHRRHSGKQANYAIPSLGSSQLHSPALELRQINGDVKFVTGLASGNCMSRTRSDGSLYEQGLSTVHNPFA